jgi:fatty acid synthase
VSLSPGTGKFEICEHGALVASGTVRAAADDKLQPELNGPVSGDSKTGSLNLSPDDIYKELRLRGYDYGPTFRGIVSATGNGMHLAQ